MQDQRIVFKLEIQVTWQEFWLYCCIEDFPPKFSPVQFSHSFMSNSLWPHWLQLTRIPCPSPTPGACSNSCPWVGDAIQPSHPLSSFFPPAFSLSQHQGLFRWVSSSHQWPKYWSFSFSIIPSSEHPGLISFRMDWLDLDRKSTRLNSSHLN